jgi:outer membrane cobalamin receptor
MGTARITFLLALGASLWGAAGTVEVDAPRPQSEASASVTVTAEALPVELAQTPNRVQVVDKSAIDQSGAVNLGGLLQQQLPGQVFTNGGVGMATSISLGGARPQDTVVTLDGLRLEDANSLGGVNASVIALAGIDRVEIQTGPCSTRFGSDAMGGSVALFTAGSAPAGFSGEVRAGAGNEGIVRGGLGAAYGWDKGWIRMAFTAQKEDQVLDPSNPYRSAGAFLGLGYQLGEDTLVTMNYYNTYTGLAMPINSVTPPRSTTGAYPSYVAFQQDFNHSQILSGTVRTQFSPVLSGELTLGQVLQDRIEPNWVTYLPSDPYNSRRNQATGHITWEPSSAGSLMLGLDGSDENATSPNAYDESQQFTATAKHLAVYAEGTRELLPNLRGVASLRTERDDQSVPQAPDASLTQTTVKLGLNWILAGGLRAFANAGTGFSAPLLYDALFNATNGNGVALNNEKSRTAQVGLSYGDGPWKSSLVLSRTLFSNLIHWDSENQDGYLNSGHVRIQSAEFKAGYETKVWGMDGFYRNQEVRDLQAAPDQQLSSAGSIVNSPFQTLGANGYRVLGDFRLEGRWSWIGPRYLYGVPGGFRQHYNDLALSAVWNARKDLAFTLRGENLMQPKTSLAQWLAGTRDFQNDASQIYGYPAQPPTVTAEVRYRF